MTVLTTACLTAPGGGVAAEPPLRFGDVTVVSRDIYAPHEVANATGPVRLLRRVMNGLHVNTQERILRRELLFAKGEPYDPGLLEETARNLRGLGYVNDVKVVATDTTASGDVDVLVSVRDAWSLSTSFSYSLASGGEQRWNVRFSEKNFLGYGVTVGAGVGADEDRTYWNLWYRKRRMFGQALWFGIDWSETGDGHVRGFFLHRPFFAQDDARGFFVEAHDIEAEQRWYLSHASPAGADPAAAGSLHARIPMRNKTADLGILWRVSGQGAGRIWRLGGGVRVTDTTWRPSTSMELSDGRVADLTWLAEPGGPMDRESGVRVFPHLQLQTVGRRWTESRFVMQYGPVEDVPLDLSAEMKTGPAGGAVGSTAADGAAAWRCEGSLEKWLPLGRSFVLLRVDAVGQAGEAAVRSHGVELLTGWMAQAGSASTPWLTRVFAEAGHGSALTGADAFVLGLDRGLRTLDFDGMAGDRLVRWNVEQGKVLQREVLGLFGLGAAAFYGGGCAWWEGEDRGLEDARHEVGCGLRLGPTRSANSQVTRIDVAWALNGEAGPVFTAVTRGYF